MRKLYGLGLLLMIIVCLPAVAYAQALNITHVDVPAAGDKASYAKFAVYFDAYDRSGKPIRNLEVKDCSLTIARRSPKIVRHSLDKFIKGDQRVGVLFLFPNAKNYSEEAFGIRHALVALAKKVDRGIDQFNFVAYDISTEQTGWERVWDGAFDSFAKHAETTDVLEPNLFASMLPALDMLKKLQDVDRKFLVMITDAEGAVFDNRDRALQMAGMFSDELQKNGVTPIVVNYSPDGMYAMPNIQMLNPIIKNGGRSFVVENRSDFEKLMTDDVYDYIWGSYIYHVAYDLTEDDVGRIEPGKYYMQLQARTPEGSVTGYSVFNLEELEWWNLMWLWIALGGACAMGLIGFGVYRLHKNHARKTALRRRLEAEERWAEKVAREFAEDKSNSLQPVPLPEDESDSEGRVLIRKRPVCAGAAEESDSVEVLPVDDNARKTSDKSEVLDGPETLEEAMREAEARLARALKDADREDSEEDEDEEYDDEDSEEGEEDSEEDKDDADDEDDNDADSEDKSGECAASECKASPRLTLPDLEREAHTADVKHSGDVAHVALIDEAGCAHSEADILEGNPHQRFEDKFSIYMDGDLSFADTGMICVTKEPPADLGMTVWENMTTVREYANGEGMLGMDSIRKDA